MHPKLQTARYLFFHGQAALEANRTLCDHMEAASRQLGFNPSKQPLSVFLHDEEKQLIAGGGGYVFPGWLFIDLLFVEASYRKQGVGASLLKQMENEGVRLGAHSAYLWTQDFEAPGFYRKHGYSEFVELEEFMPGHQLFGMRKKTGGKTALDRFMKTVTII